MLKSDLPHRWPAALDEAIAQTHGRFTQCIVLSETDSTQDAARRMRLTPGTIVTALRQVRGRGRLGRAWTDTAGHGIALTCCLPRTLAELATLAAPVAIARTLADFTNYAVGIKWPNDVLIQGRKIAGVLIECTDDRADLGIGINISQTDWPPELADRAISLHQLGATTATRLAVLTRLLPFLADCFKCFPHAIAAEFAARDVLTGTIATFLNHGETVTGRVESIDPARGLAVKTATGRRWLPALTTTVVPPSSAAGG